MGGIEVARQDKLVAADAEDLAVVAVTTLHESFDASEVRDPRALLTTIVRRRAIDLNIAETRRLERPAPVASVTAESSIWSVPGAARTPSLDLRESEAAGRQRAIAELVLELLEGRDRELLVMRAFREFKFADIAVELGFESAQVARNRWAKIIDQAMVGPEVLRRMPDGYAWAFIESVCLADGDVRGNVERALGHLSGEANFREAIMEDIKEILRLAGLAVSAGRGRPGLKAQMARRLVAGAAHYVHRADDVHHDFHEANGLDDDWLVVRSVCRALDIELPGASFTVPASVSYFLA